MSIETGYWLCQSEDWDCLNDTPYGDIEYMLHGDCVVFAQALRDTFGYDIYSASIYDYEIEENRLVHAFCITPADILVDVRGCIDDFELFMEPFEDEFCSLDDLDVRKIDVFGYQDTDAYHHALRVISGEQAAFVL